RRRAGAPLPPAPARVGRRWGGDGRDTLRAAQNADRDELIAALARAADQYGARDLRVQIETTIVEDAVALPLSIQPVVAISDRSIEGVDPRPGGVASLTSGVADWTVADG